MASSDIAHLTDGSFNDAVGDRAKIAKLNVDEGGATAARFGIQAIPTLLLLRDGGEINRFVGVQRQDTLVSAMEKALEV